MFHILSNQEKKQIKPTLRFSTIHKKWEDSICWWSFLMAGGNLNYLQPLWRSTGRFRQSFWPSSCTFWAYTQRTPYPTTEITAHSHSWLLWRMNKGKLHPCTYMKCILFSCEGNEICRKMDSSDLDHQLQRIPNHLVNKPGSKPTRHYLDLNGGSTI